MRNLSIQLGKLIAAILVVAIHTEPLRSISPLADYLLCHTLARLAVPFFFAVAGYYFAQNLERKGTAYLFSYFKKTGIAYVCWSAFYFLLFELSHFLFEEKTFLQAATLFFRNLLLGLWSLPLWFVPALLAGLLISALLQRQNLLTKIYVKILMLVLFAGACFFTNYQAFLNMPSSLLSLQDALTTIGGHAGRNFLFMGIPLVYMGFLIAKTERPKHARTCFGLSFIAYIAVSLLAYAHIGYYNPEVSFLCGIAVFFLIHLLLADPLRRQIVKRANFLTRYDFSIGIYYIHFFYLRALQRLIPSIHPLATFVLTIAISILTLYIIKKYNIKYLRELV